MIKGKQGMSNNDRTVAAARKQDQQ